jgi:hypothetical protein
MKKLMIESSDDFTGLTQWTGFVYDPSTATVYTACIQRTRAECAAWLDDAVTRTAWLDGSELPDLHDAIS